MLCSLQTLINPQGANKYKTFGKRSGWDDKKGDGKGPGKGPGPGGPRMSGMGNINTLSDHSKSTLRMCLRPMSQCVCFAFLRLT